MKPAMRALGAHLRAHLAVMMHYRGEVLLWSIWGIVNPAVLYAMWSAAAGGSASHEIAGYDRGGLAAYFLIMMIVGHLTGAWDVYQMGFFVRTGALSPMLLQPVLPIWRSVAENVAYKVVTLMFTIPVWIIFAWIVAPHFQPTAWSMLLGVVALALGAVLAFVLCYVVSLFAFWAPKIDALGEVYFGLCMFLGGRFAPIDALPGPIASLARVMPFKWMYEFPTELFIGGRLTPTDACVGLLIQCVWIAVSLAAFRLTWIAGLKRYTAVSG